MGRPSCPETRGGWTRGYWGGLGTFPTPRCPAVLPPWLTWVPWWGWTQGQCEGKGKGREGKRGRRDKWGEQEEDERKRVTREEAEKKQRERKKKEIKKRRKREAA